MPPGGVGRISLPEAFSFGVEQAPVATGHVTNDYRGWEWRYLWQLCQTPAVRLGKLQQGITGLSFATNGDWLAVTMLGGKRAELWSRLQQRRLQVLTTDGCGAAQSWRAAFSPTAPLLAIGLAKGAVLVTNLATGTHWTVQTGALIGDTNMMADKVAFSPDGRRLAALGGHWWGTKEKGTLFVWETSRFSLVNTNASGPIGDSYGDGDLAWLPDSQRLWIGAKDSSFEELPASGGPRIRGSEAGTDGRTLAVSPSGETLATTGVWDGVIQIWDIRVGAPLVKIRELPGHGAFVSRLEYSPDGRWLATASADQTIRLWNTTTWESIELRGHVEEVHALAFTPDGSVLASGSRDGEVLLWRLDPVETLWESLRENRRLPKSVHSAVIAPGSKQLLAKLRLEDTTDETLTTLALIDARTLVVTPLPFAAGESRIWPDGLAVLSDAANGLTFIEVKDSGYRMLGQSKEATNVFKTPRALQDRIFAFVSSPNTVTCVPLDDPSRKFQLTAGQEMTQLDGLAFRGGQLFAWDRAGGILFWDLREKRLLRRVELPGCGVLWQPELPDLIVFNWRSEKAALEFRDLAHPEKVLKRIETPYSIHGNQTFSPDHQLLAISIQDAGSLLLLDVPSRTLKRSLQRHLMSVRAPTFSPDGRRLASGGGFADNVKLWDVETGQELLSLATESALNSFVQFSDDGNLILAQNWYLWRAPSWEEIRQAEESLKSRRASVAGEAVAEGGTGKDQR